VDLAADPVILSTRSPFVISKTYFHLKQLSLTRHTRWQHHRLHFTMTRQTANQKSLGNPQRTPSRFLKNNNDEARKYLGGFSVHQQIFH